MERQDHPRDSTLIVFARHGETALNAAGRFRGREDPVLTATGERQARALGRALAERPATEVAPTALYASPRQRAAATAKIVGIALGLEPATLPDLDDFDYGAWAGRDEAEVQRAWPALHSKWRTDPHEVQFPDGEAVRAAVSRVAAFLTMARDRHAGAAVIAVTHDAVIRCAVCQTLVAPLTAYHRVAINLASTTGVVVGSTPRLLWVNESFHLRWF